MIKKLKTKLDFYFGNHDELIPLTVDMEIKSAKKIKKPIIQKLRNKIEDPSSKLF